MVVFLFSADDKLMVFFLFSRKMALTFPANCNLHQISKPVSEESKTNISKYLLRVLPSIMSIRDYSKSVVWFFR